MNVGHWAQPPDPHGPHQAFHYDYSSLGADPQFLQASSSILGCLWGTGYRHSVSLVLRDGFQVWWITGGGLPIPAVLTEALQITLSHWVRNPSPHTLIESSQMTMGHWMQLLSP